MTNAVGIIGCGVYLPPNIRTNDWWPESIVDAWRSHDIAALDRPADGPQELSEGARLIDEAMAEYRSDPFRGARERRIMPEGMKASDMELAAAREALARSGVRADQLGLILSAALTPDHLLMPQSARLHHGLGAARHCMSLQTESACNAIHHQFSLASDKIAAGKIDYALITQSAAWQHFFPKEAPPSAWHGEGATAMVIGRVEDGFGLLAEHHETDGQFSDALVFGVPGKRWYDNGPVQGYLLDKDQARGVVTSTVEDGSRVLRQAVHNAGLEPSDVDFYGSHQGFAWLRRVTQKLAGLDRARSLDTFPWAGNLAVANVPLVLAMAEREGLLRKGDVVATMSGGSGVTLSSMVMRWSSGVSA